MSSEKAVCLRFPNGTEEMTLSDWMPKLGDRLTRGPDRWEVLAIVTATDEKVVATLGLLRAGQAERQAQLARRSECLAVVSAALRRDAEQLRRHSKSLRA